MNRSLTAFAFSKKTFSLINVLWTNRCFCSKQTFNGDEESLPRPLSVYDYSCLIRNDDDLSVIRNLIEEYDYLKQTTGCVPQSLTVNNMKRLTFMTKNKRRDFLAFLCDVELKESNSRKGKSCETLFLNLNSDVLKSNLFSASQFNQHLVFDFSYEEHMNEVQLFNMCTELSRVYYNNLRIDYPFNIWFCNYNFESATHKILMNDFFTRYKPKPFIHFEERSYLDLFPKDNLMYLTRDTEKNLLKYNHDYVFVIGAIHDIKSEVPGLTLQKARREQVMTSRLPVNRFVDYPWSFNFTVPVVHKILSSMKEIGDWKTAFLSTLNRSSEKRFSSDDVQKMEAKHFKRTSKRITKTFSLK